MPQVLLDRAVCLMELGKFDAAQQPLTDLANANPNAAQIAEGSLDVREAARVLLDHFAEPPVTS